MRISASLLNLQRRLRRGVFPSLDDRRFLVRRYHRFTGSWPNLRDPQTYREKLLWLNLYHRDPLIPVLADKFLARQEVARRIGPAALVEMLGVWDCPDEIPFDQLTDPFVLKTTAGSGQNLFCWDKTTFDIPAAVRTLRTWLQESYYERYREWCYRPLKPRIIVEKLMVDPAQPGRSPDDLKVHCFNGAPKMIKFCTDRRGDRRYESLDPQWNRLDLGLTNGKAAAVLPPRPDGLDDLLETARKLSAGFPYVRVDLYRHEGHTVFGEMTWFPFAGNVPMENRTVDRMMGDWIQLPQSRSKQIARALLEAARGRLPNSASGGDPFTPPAS